MRRRTDFLITFGCAAAGVLLAWVLARYVLGWVLPFLIALSTAALTEPLIRTLRKRLHLQRGFLAVVLTALVVGTAAALLTVLAVLLVRQAMSLLEDLPAILAGLPERLRNILDRLESFCAACPEGLQNVLERGITLVNDQLSALVGRLSAAGVRWLAALVAALPRILLFAATTVLAMFFTAACYPRLTAFVGRQLSAGGREKAQELKGHILQTLGKWLRAECILIAITFGELLTGFLLLRQPYALLLAVLVALIDALPVFGTGTVLLPWALGCCLIGDFPKGIALTALYAVIMLVRSITEPKIMAAQAGLPPLAALMAMYVGFRTLGVGGMILCPILLLLCKQLHDGGFLHLWK